jgi:pimeloyl-ACP methyl ester carboxylesterase
MKLKAKLNSALEATPSAEALASRPRRALAASAALAVAAALAAMALALAAPLTRTAAAAVETGSSAKPQLLLFHGGAFLFDDPSLQRLTERRAIAAGFVPHYVDYPLGDLAGAVAVAEAEARRLGEEFGVDHVYAYGFSAGGTLAALLSGSGLVAAAVAKAPPTDLSTWKWPTETYAHYDERIGADPEELRRLSPTLLPAQNPLLIYQGRGDRVVPPAMNEAFAAKYPRVHFWSVPGGHWTDRIRPYLISNALEWLGRVAGRRMAAAAAPTP